MFLKDLFEFLPKSNRPASFGSKDGIYPFFTSSNTVDKYVNDFDYEGEYLIIGDGGTANCKYYKGKFSASDHNYILKPKDKVKCKLVRYFLMKDNYKILSDGFKGVGIKNVSKTYIQNINFIRNTRYTDEEIIETAKQIGINNIILQLENGYNTKINDNDEISTGIKQLVVLLQNIVSKASILVFDEATNMLDNEIEEKIEEAMNYICKQKTLIIIAHKLKTIKDADYIYVVENGIIVEHGKHEQLIGNNSYYSKRYNN